jgi:hypothetical protein
VSKATTFYRWLIRQVSQHNQEDVIQQKHAEALHEVLVELCEACADGDHVAAPHKRGSNFNFCKDTKREEFVSKMLALSGDLK